jgi:hypothetical protein
MIQYQLPGGQVSTARVPETFLKLIQQGWNSPVSTARVREFIQQGWNSPSPELSTIPPSSTATPPPPCRSAKTTQEKLLGCEWQQPPPLSEQPQVAPEPHFPSIAEPQPPKKLWAGKYPGSAIEDVMFRLAPDPKADPVQPEPIPGGSEVSLYADCEVWRGWRGELDVENIWCPVIYGNRKGWAEGHYLMMRDGRTVACIMYPTDRFC